MFFFFLLKITWPKNKLRLPKLIFQITIYSRVILSKEIIQPKTNVTRENFPKETKLILLITRMLISNFVLSPSLIFPLARSRWIRNLHIHSAV
jgi:hypothetical protein